MSDDYQRYDPSAPKPPIPRPTPIDGALLTVGVLAAITIVVVAFNGRRALPVASPVLPPAPPCIHETCVDRAARLVCNHTTNGMYPTCDGFDIQYEHHCDCDTWGTVPADGGAP